MEQLGFIDEYGDSSLEYNKEGVTTFFIVSAIIVSKDKAEQIRLQLNEIIKKYTNAPEIKSSSKTFKDIDKRLAFLKEIATLDFNIYSVIVDKRKVFEDSGLQHKKSFFKYVNNLLDAELYNYFPYLELVADQHGTEKFMEGFIDYIAKKHHQTELFGERTFRFADSKTEIFIQLADFISGSLARYYDPKKQITDPTQIIKILSPRILHLREWPDTTFIAFKEVGVGDEQFDQKIVEFALQLAQSFINKNSESADSMIKNQLLCLNYLIYKFQSTPIEYIYADEILERINKRGINISRRIFSKEIIGKLREAGILIVSSQNGYKIPCSKADLIRFFNNYNSKILPMLETMKATNKLVKVATNGTINMFGIVEFKVMESLIEAAMKQ